MDFPHIARREDITLPDRKVEVLLKTQLTADDMIFFSARQYAERRKSGDNRTFDVPRTLEAQITRVPYGR